MARSETFASSYSRVRADWLAEDAIRITHAPPDAADFPADPAWLKDVLIPSPGIQQDPPETAPTAEALSVSLADGLVNIQARPQTGGPARTVLAEAQPPLFGLKHTRPFATLDVPKAEARLGLERVRDGIQLSFGAQPDEIFYGWGEWFDAFARRSGSLHMKIRDAISMLQGGETYSAIPFFLSSRGYGCLVLNSYPSRWRLEPQQNRLVVEADGPGLDYILVYGPSFKKILNTYTRLTGRPPLLPRWAFGLWLTSYPQEDQEAVQEYVRQHRSRGIPLDAVILDYHWEERFHNFRWRQELFPNPEKFMAGMKSLGARLGLILTPFVNKRSRPFQKWMLKTLAHNIPAGMENADERPLPEYEETRAQGLLAHADAKWWFGAGGMLDFTNPRASAWWNAKLKPLFDQGVAFFKNDDGEYLPEDAHSAIGLDGGAYHNLYGLYYGKAMYEGMQALDERRPLIYARSVWAGSQRYPALFLGDQKPTFESLAKAMRAGLNMSLLGFAYWGADVFGLDGKTTPETHIRHAQWTLLNPIARYFNRPAAIDNTRLPWSQGAQAEASFRLHVELRYRLLPYYTALGYEAYQKGLPLMRPLVLEFQDDPRLAEIYDQMLLGDRLMLCPVMHAGALSRHIFLPAGTWYDWWTDQRWEGPGEVDISAPLEHLPILVRGGTMIPLGSVLQNIPDGHTFNRLELHLWPPYPAQFSLYDDDGASRLYQQGQVLVTNIHAELVSSRLVIRLSPQGTNPRQDHPTRQVTFVLHDHKPPLAVRLNGEILSGWEPGPEQTHPHIQAPCPTHQETVIEIQLQS